MATLNAQYITIIEMARDSGQHRATVYNWLKYHRYMEYERVLEKTVVRRDVWERFKGEHPELIKTAEVAQ